MHEANERWIQSRGKMFAEIKPTATSPTTTATVESLETRTDIPPANSFRSRLFVCLHCNGSKGLQKVHQL